MKERRDVPIKHLFIDGENPRHDPIDNEPQIIATLAGSEKVLELATSIAKIGLSPLENLGAIAHPEHKGRYIVLEGNRRVCAILLLADPERAPKESQRNGSAPTISSPTYNLPFLKETRRQARQ